MNHSTASAGDRVQRLRKLRGLTQQDLARLGIQLNVLLLDFPSLAERISRTFNYESVLMAFTSVALDPSEQKELHTRGRLVVEDVSGPALAAGLQAGDVVLGVNGAGVSTVAELKREVARAGHSVALLIQREDAQIYVPIDLG